MMVGANCKVSGELRISPDEINNLANDGQLIERARNDAGAFAQLYRRHYDAVFRYCTHRLFDRHLAEDVTSTVFLDVVKNFYKFTGDERQFRNWLYTIATAAVNDHLRRKFRWENLLPWVSRENHQITNETAANDVSDRRFAVLKEAMLSLQPKYQTIITLRFFENLKFDQIAEVLGASSGTVRSQLTRGLVKLREKMGRLERQWEQQK
jgi:RNA polymerase sigma factor (sigma-70 family)